MALFSIDALAADRCPTPEEIRALVEQDLAMLFPTGADGGYLLHAYVDESIPDEVTRYCIVADRKKGSLALAGGRLGFGGVESMFEAFKPNAQIRSDCTLPPGRYEVIAFRTEYPDEIAEAKIEATIGARGRRLLNVPAYVIIAAIALATCAAVLKFWVAALAIVVLSAVGLKVFFSNPAIKRLQEQERAVHLEFPSMVVEMRSVP